MAISRAGHLPLSKDGREYYPEVWKDQGGNWRVDGGDGKGKGTQNGGKELRQKGHHGRLGIERRKGVGERFGSSRNRSLLLFR